MRSFVGVGLPNPGLDLLGPSTGGVSPPLRFRSAFCTFFLHEPSPLIPSFFNRLELSITMGVFYYDGCVSILIDIISQIGFLIVIPTKSL